MAGLARGRRSDGCHCLWAALSMTAPVTAAATLALAAGQPVANVTDTPATQPPVNVTEAPRPASEPAPLPVEDGPSYPISGFNLRYAQDPTGLPLLEEIARTEVVLGRVEGGYVEPRPGVPTVRLRINEIADRGVERYYASAITAVSRAILQAFADRHLIAVLVSPSPDQIPSDPMDQYFQQDLRPAGQTELEMVIRVGVVTDVRTLAFGDRVPVEERINSPAHAKIRERSPVQPTGAGIGRRDLLRRDLLDEFVFRLNRHPGRRVDISIAAADAEGGVALDYLVNENRPWLVYGQISNTGTKQTNEWRERFGFINNQLTGNDDILSLDFITAGFEETNAFVGSYEAPVFGSDRLRWRAYGQWNEFTASDVGFDEDFTGDGYQIGGEVIYNFYQAGEFFLDAFGGARYQHVSVTNPAVGTGEGNFFIPYFGARVERTTDLESTIGSIRMEFSIPDIDDDDLDRLGRLNTDDDWVVLQWDLTHAFYLEPLINRRRWQTDPRAQTLAHELAVSFRGQYAFDNRLIPNAEQVIGGLYSVRGYPESVAAGDTVLVGSVEYRWHIPRSLAIQPDPSQTPLFGQPFRFSPQAPYGRADWDLVFRTFLDVGRTITSDRQGIEKDQTLIGTGVGVELLFKRNLSVRADWGIALEEVDGEVDSGDSRVHFSATILF